jgi:hypothetical protein
MIPESDEREATAFAQLPEGRATLSGALLSYYPLKMGAPNCMEPRSASRSTKVTVPGACGVTE